MGYYPVFLHIQERCCVVIGTGPEVERKIQGLLEAGARVTVISEQPSLSLLELKERGDITLHSRPYSEGDLAGVFLAISATTENVELSRRIAEEARCEHVLLNVMDITDLCTWIAPALVKRGKLTMAISTSALSPAMARLVREEIEETVPIEYGNLLDVVAEVRKGLRARGIRPHPDRWNAALRGDIKSLLAKGDLDGIASRLLQLLDPQPDSDKSACSDTAML